MNKLLFLVLWACVCFGSSTRYKPSTQYGVDYGGRFGSSNASILMAALHITLRAYRKWQKAVCNLKIAMHNPFAHPRE